MERVRYQFLASDELQLTIPRRYQARSMALAIQGCSQAPLQQSTGLDPKDRRDRGRAREVQQGKLTLTSHRVGTNTNDCHQGTEKFGFNVDKNNNITYREWAPNATQAFLIGDFSQPLTMCVSVSSTS